MTFFEKISDHHKGQNMMISPLSIYHILSLATNGAAGETKKEMLDVLNNKNQEEMNEKNKLIYSLIDNLKTVKFANAAFLNGRILDSFKKYLKLYKAGIEELKSAQQINGWVIKATKGLIKKIMKKYLLRHL